MAKTALLIGSTGLIGQQILELLLVDSDYEKVIAISRKPLANSNPKLQNVICELKQLADFKNSFLADDVFCCLGTTMKTAKSKEAFRAVDFDAPLQIAQLTKALGTRQYLLVSALGANKDSGIFYNRVKGEVEEAIARVGFESFHVMRPSLLTGPRQEHRAGEKAAQVAYQIFGFLIPKKYLAIQSIKVARAMLRIAKKNQKGLVIHESVELQDY
jgi:uncharacterized protein YbjT (DUF2867 family)